jgi:two-component system CheB/CheR fusion protein
LHVTGDDLEEVLKGLAENVKRMFSISCDVAVHGRIPGLNGNTTLQLHKIAQEAVSNAIKHGKAQKVNIALTVEDDRLTLVVENDGMPFTAPRSSNGWACAS